MKSRRKVEPLAPKVAILMATFEPDLTFFEKQIESLKRQTHNRWVCLLSDDGSDPKRAARFFERVSRLAQSDSRFRLLRHPHRAGVYHNFERALAEVPEDAAFVCFADQDDIWVPHKLERLLSAFDDPNVSLAHSDLSIIDSQDRLVHASCWEWEGRSTSRYEPELLLLKNTVTGCTSMFRRELVSLLLPFPPQSTSPAYHHDLWTALLATSCGEIRAFAEPLVMYRQHERNVLGPLDSGEGDGRTRFREVGQVLGTALSRDRLAHFAGWSLAEWNLRHKLWEAYRARLEEARRRGIDVKPTAGNPFHSAPDLGIAPLYLMARARLAGYSTRGADFRTALGKLGHDVKRLQRILAGSRRVERRLRSTAQEQITSYLFKAGLPVRPVASETFRDQRSQRDLPLLVEKKLSPALNLLVPNVKRELIFGGIATALKLGIEVARLGTPVRFFSTEDELDGETREGFAAYLRERGYPGEVILHDLTAATRERPMVGSRDLFLATAWWTALLADRALQSHPFSQRKFVYLIQDYEPGFYPWSQDYALAEQSYRLGSYHPIFNTTFLEAYFRAQKLVPKGPSWTIRPEVDTRRFFPLSAEQLKERHQLSSGKVRLLIYGRPHVARNLFPTIVAGLDAWIRKHALTSDQIEIVSAGERHPPVAFPGGILMESAGKQEADQYPSFLRGFDIGVSLMLSPHPSYPPLEMAASGMVTITTRYANKDLEALSDNLISCDPDPRALPDALDRALARVPKSAARVSASRLKFADAETLSQVAQALVRLIEEKPRLPQKSRRRSPRRDEARA